MRIKVSAISLQRGKSKLSRNIQNTVMYFVYSYANMVMNINEIAL